MNLIPAPVLPPLPPPEYGRLCESIKENGVLVPLLATDAGIIIDGHERYRAAQEVGLTKFPIRVLGNLSDAERREMSIRCNIERRHLSQPERRRLLEDVLRTSPSRSTRDLADLLCISNATVSRARARLGVAGVTPEAIRGRDGKTYTYKPAYSAESRRQADEAARLLAELGPDAPTGGSTLRKLRHAAYKKRAELVASGPAANLPAEIQIECCDFRQLESKVGDLSRAADLALLDPPWSGDWYGNLADLATMTMRILKPGGVTAVYCGQGSMPKFLSSFMSAGLTYRWIVACQNGTILCPRRAGGHVKSHWRSLLLFSRGPFRSQHFLDDLLALADDVDERFQHPLNWNQPVGESKYIIERLTQPGALIVDLTCGSGTVAAATVEVGGGRKFAGCDSDRKCVKIARRRASDALEEVPAA